MVFCINSSFAQAPVWDSYNATTVIYSAKFENNYLWVASSGGVTRLDTASRTCTFYNEFNSGLPTPNVFSVAIDQLNNKWFGTGGGPTGTSESVYPGAGLVKFNGSSWTVYNTVNSGLPHNTVRALFIDSVGDIWSGTYGGLSKYNGSSWTTYNRANSSIPSDSVTCITVDSLGKKWIGTYHGLACFDGSAWTVYKRTTSGLPGDTIRSVSIGPNNEKWVATSKGVAKFDDVSWTIYTTANSGLPYNNVTAILADTDGTVWMGTYGTSTFYGSGVAKFDGVSTWTVYKQSNSALPKDNVSIIFRDAAGNKWISSERGQRHGGGVGEMNKFDGTNWTTYSITNSGTLSNFCYHIETNGNDLWFGGEKAGLTKYDGTSWVNYNTENSGIGDDDILDLKIDTAGNIWTIHDWGRMTKFDGTNFTVLTSPLGTGDDPRCLFIDANGDKWIGENGTGIYIWDDTTWTHIVTGSSGLPNNKVYSIAADSSGNKWIGTFGGGVAKYDGVSWTVYNTSTSGLLSNNVQYVTVDRFQNKWIATQNGLAKFDGTSWVVYRTVNSGLPSNSVFCVAFDDNDVLWAATSNGMATFDGTTWTTYDYTIPSNFSFRYINFDTAGNVWVGTLGRGIVKITVPPVITGIKPAVKEINTSQNYPNPFSTETTIPINDNTYTTGIVSLMVYDALGKKVNPVYTVTVISGKRVLKLYSAGLDNGAYYYMIVTDKEIQTGKLMVHK